MEQSSSFTLGQRVHSSTDPRRVGTVKYVGDVEGHLGTWVGVDWDREGDGKHDGSINGVRYFQARFQNSASFVRAHNLSPGISLLEALKLRYQSHSTKQDEDEMYVLSASNKRVSVQLLGKDKIQDKLSRFEELKSASISYLGVTTPGGPDEIRAAVPNLMELDLTGNLILDWKVEILEHSLPVIEELHLMGNNISTIKPTSSSNVRGFDSLQLLNLEDNCLAEWNEILKLSQLKSLEQLYLNKNKFTCIFYPDKNMIQELLNHESSEESCLPFQNLRCLLLGSNKISDLASIDSLNSFPKLIDIRLSDNPIADPGRGGLPRFVLIARLAKVEMLNGSEISARERKESEIRYVRLVMSKLLDNPEEIKQLHPRFVELKNFYGIEDERPLVGAAGPQKMASGLLSITLKCVALSVGEKLPLTKKLPATTTVGKLKALCESFFKLKSLKLKLFLQEEGSPLPMLLDDEMASLMDIGIGNESTILVDEES
ncbi:tubulin-folding cofactor E isoform X2 [Durio zibethinus]|uniref:Tubulin-folding cofactor E isoform X2 n=1 Tax=Durio zibethinus TaxID=66656 RepID=A0A6P5WR30_DURZI|nr:tubulin-folding cofactor E isoform X2 [Durio zibethinus]